MLSNSSLLNNDFELTREYESCSSLTVDDDTADATALASASLEAEVELAALTIWSILSSDFAVIRYVSRTRP